jgi:hypothetical protein
MSGIARTAFQKLTPGTLNAVIMYRTAAVDRIKEMNNKHNGKIPFTLDNYMYMFGGPSTTS